MLRRMVVLGCVFMAGCAVKTKPEGPYGCHDRVGQQMPACILRTPGPAAELKDVPVTARADARCEWNATGVRLEKGAQYRLTAAKVVEGWADSWQVESDLRDGWPRLYWLGSLLADPKARAKGLPMYALVGTEGRDARKSFVVGWGTTHTAATDEDLFVFANDWSGESYYGNNHGCVEVTIEKIAEPPPTAPAR